LEKQKEKKRLNDLNNNNGDNIYMGKMEVPIKVMEKRRLAKKMRHGL